MHSEGRHRDWDERKSNGGDRRDGAHLQKGVMELRQPVFGRATGIDGVRAGLILAAASEDVARSARASRREAKGLGRVEQGDPMRGMLIVIGAMKCGTSTLHEHLGLHPDISMSRVKELNYFIETANFAKGERWYRSRFSSSSEIRGESSPNYTKWPMFPGVPERMYAAMPDAKLVYIVRDPVDRAVSHYRHNVSHGRETRPIAEALGERENNNYVTSSSYHLQIQRFLQFFPAKQLRLFELSELANDPRAVSREIFEWVGVASDFDHPGFDKVLHKSSKKRKPTPLGRKVQAYPGGRTVRSVLARWLEAPLDKPKLDDATRESLRNALRADAAALREFWDRPLEHWQV